MAAFGAAHSTNATFGSPADAVAPTTLSTTPG